MYESIEKGDQPSGEVLIEQAKLEIEKSKEMAETEKVRIMEEAKKKSSGKSWKVSKSIIWKIIKNWKNKKGRRNEWNQNWKKCKKNY